MNPETISTIYLIAAVVTVIIEIWLIVKFVELCSDVRKIRDKQEPARINAAIVRKAMLTGTTDAAYNAIISRLVDFLDNCIVEYWEDPEPKINNAQKLCAMMGRELPPQLRTLEAYRAFATTPEEAERRAEFDRQMEAYRKQKGL